jgi:hypothetical protein
MGAYALQRLQLDGAAGNLFARQEGDISTGELCIAHGPLQVGLNTEP